MSKMIRHIRPTYVVSYGASNVPEGIRRLPDELSLVVKQEGSLFPYPFPYYDKHLQEVKDAISDKNTRDLDKCLGYFMECGHVFTITEKVNLDAYGNSFRIPPEYIITTKPLLEWMY